MLSITARDTSRAGEGTHQERCLVELRRREGPDATPSRVSTWQRRCCSRLAGIRCQAAHERSGSCRCRCRLLPRLIDRYAANAQSLRAEGQPADPLCQHQRTLGCDLDLALDGRFSWRSQLGMLACSRSLSIDLTRELMRIRIHPSTHPSIHPSIHPSYYRLEILLCTKLPITPRAPCSRAIS